MPAITLTNEGMDPVSIPLKRATMLIGNDPEAEVYLDNEVVSRNHASILYEDDQFVIHDNGSTNGTFVNGQKIVRHRLDHNDQITFGPYQFQVDLRGATHRTEIKGHPQRYHNSKGSAHRSSVDFQPVKGSSGSSHLQVVTAGEIAARREPGKHLVKTAGRFWGLFAGAVLLGILALVVSGKMQSLVSRETMRATVPQLQSPSSAGSSSDVTETSSARRAAPVLFVSSMVAGAPMMLGILGGIAVGHRDNRGVFIRDKMWD